jgi:hypothetical protein
MTNSNYVKLKDYNAKTEKEINKEVDREVYKELNRFNSLILCKIVYSLFLYIFLEITSRCFMPFCVIEKYVKNKHEQNCNFLNKLTNNINSEETKFSEMLRQTVAQVTTHELDTKCSNKK